MKINCKVLTMALGGAVLPWGLASAGDSSAFPKPLTSVGSLSDAPIKTDSTTIATQRPVMSLDQRPAAFRENIVEGKPAKGGQVFHNAGYATSINENASISMPIPDAAPMMGEPMMGSTHSAMPTSGCSTGSCGSSSCESGSCGGAGCDPCSIGSSCGSGCRKRFWFETEALLWWAPVTRTPALVVSGPRFNLPDTLEIGGDQTLGGQMIPGMRTNFGFWVDDCESIGLGGRAFGLFSAPTTQTVTSDGSRTLAVPYFDTSAGIEDAYLLSFANSTGFSTGSATVSDDTDFVSAEAYGKILLCRSAGSRADVVGGYTFARLDTSIGLDTSTIDGLANLTPDGTRIQTSDRWVARNEFHGGHVGIMTNVSKGRFGLSTLGKVAIGTMQQSGNISGSSTTTNPSGAVIGTSNTGLLALESNSFNYARNVTTFIPEAGAKLSYRLKPSIAFAVGYTFLFLPDVALSSGMIDTNVDFASAASGGLFTPNRPAPKFEQGSYYLHGLDLGLTFTF